MKNRTFLVFVLIMSIFLLTGCSCKHEWAEATCTKPQICTLCNEAQGEPLGHSSGEVTEEANYALASIRYTQYCTICGEQLKYDIKQMTTFLKDNKLLLTPFRTMPRLDSFFEKTPEDDGYYYISDLEDWFQFYLVNNNTEFGTIFFLKEFEGWDNYDVLTTMDSLSAEEVDAISLYVAYDSNYLDLLFTLLNPNLSSEEIEERKLEVFSLLTDSSLPNGFVFWDQENGLYYEFRYIMSDNGTTIENIHITAYSDNLLG